MPAHELPEEEPLTPEQIAAGQAATALRDERSLAATSNLIAQRLPGRFAIFYDVGEGKIFPDGTEDLSGCVVDERGDHYFFWVDWDADAGQPILGTWERDEANPRDAASAEYRHARALVGLQPLVGAS
jgi:hypothetical protein